MKKIWLVLMIITMGLSTTPAEAQEAQNDEFSTYRLLSISESEKIILVSHITEKTKYLLDAAAARITRNGNPVEFNELQQFSNILIKIELERIRRSGVRLDGIATEILIEN
jgi:hypothetical protein